MFEDEAGFGRISEPSYCWAPMGVRPVVPCHRVREYVYTYGAVDPHDGSKCFIIGRKSNTAWMNEFLSVLSKQFKDDIILLCVDNASWHKSKSLKIPENIRITYLPPYTPEMNPIEQIWKEVRKDGFKNTLFKTLDALIDKLCDSLNSLTESVIKSVCGRKWIVSMLNEK
jgi:putative transposase